MARSQSQRLFAYGTNHCINAACPAVIGGHVPTDDPLIELVERYDMEAQEMVDECESSGEIPAQVAEEAWERALVQMRERAEDTELELTQRESARKAVEIGEEIKDSVF